MRVALRISFSGAMRWEAPISWTYRRARGKWGHEGASGTGVVEVDVGDEEFVDVGRIDAGRAQSGKEFVEGRCGTDLDECQLTGAL